MAEAIPDALSMREVKYGEKTPPAKRVEIADELLAVGRVAEALDLLLLAGDERGVQSIRKRAATEGRPVWLVMIARNGDVVTTAEWKACGESALRKERWREAFRAFTMAEDEAALARVQEKIPGYEIYVPQGK